MKDVCLMSSMLPVSSDCIIKGIGKPTILKVYIFIFGLYYVRLVLGVTCILVRIFLVFIFVIFMCFYFCNFL